MNNEQLLASFLAFNVNAFNMLSYVVQTNLWLILTIIGAVIILALNLKEEIVDYIDEEQNII